MKFEMPTYVVAELVVRKLVGRGFKAILDPEDAGVETDAELSYVRSVQMEAMRMVDRCGAMGLDPLNLHG